MIHTPGVPYSEAYLGTNGLWEFRKGFVPVKEASQAGMLALQLMRYADKLDFIKPEISEENRQPKGSVGFIIGIHDPDSYDPQKTIYGTEAAKVYFSPLVDVIDKLKNSFSWTEDSNYAFLFPMGPRKWVPMHTDKMSEKEERHITGLLGESKVSLVDPVRGLVRMSQQVGDTYVLRHDPDTDQTIKHGVTTGSVNSRLALMIG